MKLEKLPEENFMKFSMEECRPIGKLLLESELE